MEQLVKLIITGDSGVGKSSIIMRFADNIYDDFFLPTIGLDFSVKKFKIEDKTKLKQRIIKTIAIVSRQVREGLKIETNIL